MSQKWAILLRARNQQIYKVVQNCLESLNAEPFASSKHISPLFLFICRLLCCTLITNAPLLVLAHQFSFKHLHITRLFIHTAAEGSNETERLQIGVVDFAMFVTRLLQILDLKNVNWLSFVRGYPVLGRLARIKILSLFIDSLRIFHILPHLHFTHQVFLRLRMHIQIVHQLGDQAVILPTIQMDTTLFDNILILFFESLRFLLLLF